MMPLVQRDRLLGPQPNTLIHPLGYIVVLDLSVSQVESVHIRLESIFVSGHNRTARRCGIDPGGQRVRVIVRDRRIVLTERASSRAVAVKPCDIAAELDEAFAVEIRRLTDLARPKAW